MEIRISEPEWNAKACEVGLYLLSVILLGEK